MTSTLKPALLALSIALFGVAFSGVSGAGEMTAEAAIAAAKEAQKQANSVGGEWRDTGKLIKKAEKLLKEGKVEEAKKAAQEAEAQGMLGYIQATSQTADKLHI